MRCFVALSVLCCAPAVVEADDPAMIIAMYQAQIVNLSTQIETAVAYRGELEAIIIGLPPVSEWTATHAMIYNDLLVQLEGNAAVIAEFTLERDAVQDDLDAYIASLN